MANQFEWEKLALAIRLIKRLLPKSRRADYLSSLLTFMQYQGRLPKRENGDLNDVIFSIKASDEILNPLRVFVSDKQYLKVFVKAVVGDSYNVPTIAVINSHEEALRYNFPSDCVIKPTHMSGEVIFRRNSSKVDFARIKRWFDSNYYNWNREANYKHLERKLIIEPYIFDGKSCEDYKIFCVDGNPRLLWVDLDRQVNHKRNIYTPAWELLPLSIGPPQGNELPMPQNLSEMLRVAADLSRSFSFIRVDLYSNGKDILVGELTNCSGDTRERVYPPEKSSMVTNFLFGPERERSVKK